MLLLLDGIQELAERIEGAYRRRRPRWRPGSADPQVWVAAAAALCGLRRVDPTIPIDPELYVACQAMKGRLVDPWQELTQPEAAQRYRRQVCQIVRRLRGELRGEVRLARRRIRRGEAIEAVVLSRSRSLSPLGCSIVAFLAGRYDLVDRLRAAARDQHLACPLYRHACRGWLPPRLYPVIEVLPGLEFGNRCKPGIPRTSVN